MHLIFKFYLNIHEHWNVDENSQESDRRNVHRQVFPTRGYSQVDSKIRNGENN